MKCINLWTKRAYPLFLMAMVSQAVAEGLAQKVLPESEITGVYNFWTDGYADYIFNEEELSKTVDLISKKGLEDPHFLYDIFRTAYTKSVKMRLGSEKFKDQDLTNIETKKLIEILKGFYKEFHDFYAYGTVPVLLGYKEDNPMYQRAESLLRKKIKDHPEKFAEYWTSLTQPPKTTTKEDREMAVLKIAEKAEKIGVKNKKDIAKKFKADLEGLMKDFGYIYFDFSDKLLCDFDSCAGDVEKAVKNGNITEKMEEIKNHEKNVDEEFKRICQELRFNSEEKDYFNLVRNTGYYKWAREYEFMGALYNIRSVQDELGKRYGLSTTESKYILIDDFEKGLDGLTIKNIAKERIKLSVLVAKRDGSIKIYTGKEASDFYSKMEFIQGEREFKGNEIKGTPARAGKVTGIVRIVNFVRHIEKMEEGDILVSAATNPNLLSAMKKASAFITDEGGITCHAAIVARELKKPCITGTKIATKALHDGDMVEVDANLGVVTILAR